MANITVPIGDARVPITHVQAANLQLLSRRLPRERYNEILNGNIEELKSRDSWKKFVVPPEKEKRPATVPVARVVTGQSVFAV